ncbi:MAG: hypothetical protein OEW39_07260 [Deltaproteobacteria bacterium]|nr:hypothetical protein [Deltaproteobacteria bacterium]
MNWNKAGLLLAAMVTVLAVSACNLEQLKKLSEDDKNNNTNTPGSVTNPTALTLGMPHTANVGSDGMDQYYSFMTQGTSSPYAIAFSQVLNVMVSVSLYSTPDFSPNSYLMGCGDNTPVCITSALMPNTTYYLQVHRTNQATGSYTLTVGPMVGVLTSINVSSATVSVGSPLAFGISSTGAPSDILSVVLYQDAGLTTEVVKSTGWTTGSSSGSGTNFSAQYTYTSLPPSGTVLYPKITITPFGSTQTWIYKPKADGFFSAEQWDTSANTILSGPSDTLLQVPSLRVQ